MPKHKKIYKSLRGSSYLIARKDKPPVIFTDGFLRTSDPVIIKFIEGLADFGKGIQLVNAKEQLAALKGTPPPAAKRIDTTKNITVDSVTTVNDAQEFLVGKGVPKSKIMVKKDVLSVAAEMGISFPALEAK